MLRRGTYMQSRQCASYLDYRNSAATIVIGAIVNAVPWSVRQPAEVIVMRCQKYACIFQRRVGASQNADHVVQRDRRLSGRGHMNRSEHICGSGLERCVKSSRILSGQPDAWRTSRGHFGINQSLSGLLVIAGPAVNGHNRGGFCLAQFPKADRALVPPLRANSVTTTFPSNCSAVSPSTNALSFTSSLNTGARERSRAADASLSRSFGSAVKLASGRENFNSMPSRFGSLTAIRADW